MNIIIPLAGKGERFAREGYAEPKALVTIFEKKMINYVIDNLNINKNDKIFIIYNKYLDNFEFSKYINESYPFIKLIKINDTKGAAETLFIGIDYILKNLEYNKKCLILDCDTFYTENIIDLFRSSDTNLVFYTKNFDKEPIYSYIELNEDSVIKNVREKYKISDNANTGAYGFNDISQFHHYCKYVVDNNITFNNEPYTSCVISVMLKHDILFKGHELKCENVFSLGTPSAVKAYINNTHAFLFDLDGTIVITDDIYFNVWYEILHKYNITLDEDIFKKYIQGNNDKYVLETLLRNTNILQKDLSELKDNLFIKNIHKIKIIEGIEKLMEQIKYHGHKISIVTNCNRKVALEIIKYININNFIDFIISNDDVVCGKPHSEPYTKVIKKYNIDNNKCFVFEDSKSGILSGKKINPKLLVGIESIYDKNEIINYGVDISIKNFFDINIKDLIYNDFNNVKYIKELIKSNSTINNIKDILIDTNKLKGGFIADVISYKVITNDNKEYSQILKYEILKNNNLSIMANNLKLYEREYYFYENISNKLNVNCAKYYNVLFDENYNKIGIVLENLFEKNFKVNLNLNKESIDTTLKIIDRMARMHSSFWNKKLKKMFPELKRTDDPIFFPFLNNFIQERREIFKTNWDKILNKHQMDTFSEICNNFEKFQLHFSNSNNLTFIHGDIKSPNIFYDTENANEPYFIDWQHCAIGKGVQDLIFFIIESYDIVNIDSIFKISKEYYYMKLIEYGVDNYSYEDYEKDIYYSICYIPFFTAVWFGTIPQDELIDKNFPYFFINKMFYLIENINKIEINITD